MTLPPIRCPSCHGKSSAAQRTSPMPGGAPRPLYPCAPWARSFSAPRPPPMAPLPTPRALVVPGLATLTAGGGLNAAPRLDRVSKHRRERGPERLRGGKNPAACAP